MTYSLRLAPFLIICALWSASGPLARGEIITFDFSKGSLKDTKEMIEVQPFLAETKIDGGLIFQDPADHVILPYEIFTGGSGSMTMEVVVADKTKSQCLWRLYSGLDTLSLAITSHQVVFSQYDRKTSTYIRAAFPAKLLPVNAPVTLGTSWGFDGQIKIYLDGVLQKEVKAPVPDFAKRGHQILGNEYGKPSPKQVFIGVIRSFSLSTQPIK
jgi:hypothetical protein